MEYSQYQKNIFEFVKNEQGHGAVIATAGAAKTTSSVESMKYIPNNKEVMFTTFGKEIATTLEKKVQFMMNVSVATYNAFGWRLCMQKMKNRPKLDANKTDNTLRFAFFDNLNNDEDKKRYYKYRNSFTKLISLFKTMNCHSRDEANKILPWLLDRHDIDISNDSWYLDILLGCFERVIGNTQIFDFDDQKYMPIHLNLDFPKFDFIIVDEFQDTNLLETELIYKAIDSQNGRLMVVGDPEQSIYGFRGATPDSMKLFIETKSAKVLPLYICYRCSKAVVEEAKKIVPHIESYDQAKSGSVATIKREECVKTVGESDFVLCRTTVPITRFCLERIREGRAAFVKGKDIGTNLIQLIDRVPNSSYLNVEKFYYALSDYHQQKASELSRFNKEQQIEALKDQVETLDVLMENDCQSINDLKRKINNIFSDSGKGICCMTIHKSKGLENPNVFILRPDLLPHPKAKKDWQQEEEKRLSYVAITRAGDNLRYVLKDKDEK